MSGFAEQIRAPGSVNSMDSAAAWRWTEAGLLEERGRLGAALYWYGFVGELRLTASALRLEGFDPSVPVGPEEIDKIRKKARKRNLMTAEPHDIVGFGRYLLVLRSDLRLQTPKTLADGIMRSSMELFEHWRPRLRYKPINPTLSQFAEARRASKWIHENYVVLWR